LKTLKNIKVIPLILIGMRVFILMKMTPWYMDPGMTLPPYPNLKRPIKVEIPKKDSWMETYIPA
jgi:hypothetical protein